jgi:dihydrofolate reductase
MEGNKAFFLGTVYIIGLLCTLAALIIFGRKFGIDYDKEKSYANYDDWGSNASAYVAWSCVWFVFVPMALVLFIFHCLVQAVDLLVKEKNKIRVGIILAIGENGEIGKDNKLLWRQRAGMEHFKRKTQGCPVIMGRNTWNSLPPKFRPLPGRTNVIVTSKDTDGLTVPTADSLAGALKHLRGHKGMVWIIGGAMLYKEALEIADVVVITQVHESFPDADVKVPEFLDMEKFGFKRVGCGDKMPADEYNDYPYTFMEYEKDFL